MRFPNKMKNPMRCNWDFPTRSKIRWDANEFSQDFVRLIFGAHFHIENETKWEKIKWDVNLNKNETKVCLQICSLLLIIYISFFSTELNWAQLSWSELTSAHYLYLIVRHDRSLFLILAQFPPYFAMRTNELIWASLRQNEIDFKKIHLREIFHSISVHLTLAPFDSCVHESNCNELFVFT